MHTANDSSRFLEVKYSDIPKRPNSEWFDDIK